MLGTVCVQNITPEQRACRKMCAKNSLVVTHDGLSHN